MLTHIQHNWKKHQTTPLPPPPHDPVKGPRYKKYNSCDRTQFDRFSGIFLIMKAHRQGRNKLTGEQFCQVGLLAIIRGPQSQEILFIKSQQTLHHCGWAPFDGSHAVQGWSTLLLWVLSRHAQKLSGEGTGRSFYIVSTFLHCFVGCFENYVPGPKLSFFSPPDSLMHLVSKQI